MSRTRLTSVVLAAAALAAASPASAQTYPWKGGAASNNWSLAGNWTNGVAPLNNGTATLIFTDANFGGTPYLFPNTDANYSISSLGFTGASSFHLMTANGSTLTLGAGGLIQMSSADQTISVPMTLGASQTWVLGSGGNLAASGGINTNSQTLTLGALGTHTLTGVITGAGQLVYSGPGALTLASANTYTGGTAVTDGTLSLGAANVLPVGGTVSVANGTLNLGANNQAIGSLTLAASATAVPIVTSSGGTLTLGGNVTVAGGTNSIGGLIASPMDLGGATRTFTLSAKSGSGYDLVVSAPIGGTGGLIQDGTAAGYLALNAVNTYTGPTNVNNGSLVLGVANALPGSTAVDLAGATAQVILNPGATVQGVTAGNFGQSIGSLTGTAGSVVSLGSATLIVGNDNTNTTFAGAIGGTGGLTKQGSGTLTLTGTNAYTGPTIVDGGTLAVAAGGSLTNSLVSVDTAAVTISGTINTGTGTGQYFRLDGNFGVPTSATLNMGGALTGPETDVANSAHSTGVFTQLGGTHTATYVLTIGVGPGSSGTYNLSNGTLSTNTTIVSDRGSGAFLQTGGMHSTNGLFIGDESGGQGTYQLNAGTLSTTQTLVGNGGIGTFIQAGGTHTISSALTLGFISTGQGTYVLNAGTLSALRTSVGDYAGGTFTQTGGTQTLTTDLSVGDQTGQGTYNLSGGILTAATTYVGHGTSNTFSSGTFSQTGGTNTVSGTLWLGDFVGSSGTYTLSGGGLSTGFTTVGSAGTGTFIQAGGTHTVTGSLTVGNLAGSQGTYYLNAGTLSTNQTIVGASGSGTFLQTGGTHLVDQLILGNTGGSGTYTLSGGTLQVGTILGGAGTGTFYFNGGTLRDGTDYSDLMPGVTAVYVQAGGAIIDTNGWFPILSQSLLHDTAGLGISLDGGLTKRGAGTLTLAGTNTYTGGTVVAGGTLSVASDANLGDPSGPVTLLNGGQLQFTASVTTGRTFNLNSSFLGASAGNSITYSGAAVNGGFIGGAGANIVTNGATFNGVTTFNSAVVNVTGAGSFGDFTNGGALNVGIGGAATATFNGFTNGGSGSITSYPSSKINAVDFQSYGTLTLNPAAIGSGQISELVNTGTTPMYFNGGSRTFIGTPATAINPATGQPADLAGINLNGQNAVVAGGLFVNNGFVADGSPAGTATIIADFGSLVKGAGFFQNSVITQNGGKFQAGNSPGSATFGSFVLGPGGVNNYVFAIDDATGTAGPHPNAAGQVSGWGLVSAVRQQMGSTTTPGNFTWTADPADKVTVALDTLVNPTIVGTDIAGPMADFDPTLAYSWPAVRWIGTYSGPTDALALDAATSFDATGFENPNSGTFGWSLDAADQTLSLTYTPTAVPEPGTLALMGMAAVGWVTYWRRRWQAEAASISVRRCAGR